ncbi:MAG: hypothetical protein J7M10_03050 [Candidatus Cloacimonetes bacterium]|nr:hypothetical protein [Candidatus Cloacimonadota bacterium]
MKNIISALLLLSFVFILSCSSSTGTDTKPPTITITQPQNNETINDSIYTIQVNVTDNKNIISIRIYIDSILVANSTSKDTCSYDWHTYWWTESADHTIRVEAMDGNNNTATKTIDVTLSEQAYIVPKLLTPADNSTQQNPLNFSWTALSQAAQYEIHITINDTPFINTSTTTTYSNSFLIYGPATWQVKAQNVLGMESKFSEIFHFTLNETKN